LKINSNNKYTTIAIYTVLVFIACIVIYKFAFTWDATTNFFKTVVSVMAPFIIALFLAYLLSPTVNLIEVHLLDKLHIKSHTIRSSRLKRVISIIFTYIIVLGTMGILLSIIIPQISDSIGEIAAKAPSYVKDVIRWAQNKKITFANQVYIIDLDIVATYLEDYLPRSLNQLANLLNKFAPNILSFTKSLAKGFLNVLFGFIIATYLLYNKESYIRNSRKVLSALIPLGSQTLFFQYLHESHKIFSSFFVGKTIDSLIIGLLCFGLMLIFKIPYAILISVIVAITNMIPYFGPLIGGFIGLLFLLIGFPLKALWFSILILGLQQLDGNVIGPKILGDSTGLTPFWVIFSIVLFGSLFGIAGMFIGVPCFAVIKNIFDHSIDRRYRRKMAIKEFLSQMDKN